MYTSRRAPPGVCIRICRLNVDIQAERGYKQVCGLINTKRIQCMCNESLLHVLLATCPSPFMKYQALHGLQKKETVRESLTAYE